MLQPYRVGEWFEDCTAKVCELCETVIGRYGVLADEQGWLHVVWWPHRQWDGQDDRFRCAEHSAALRS